MLGVRPFSGMSTAGWTTIAGTSPPVVRIARPTPVTVAATGLTAAATDRGTVATASPALTTVPGALASISDACPDEKTGIRSVPRTGIGLNSDGWVGWATARDPTRRPPRRHEADTAGR